MKVVLKYSTGICFWLIAFVISRNIHSSFIPDYFNLTNLSAESTQEYFKLICEITASVFAILLAVITFGFDLLGKNSRRRKRFNFLSKWWISFIISLPVAIILFSFAFAFSIKNLQHTNDLTIAYFLGISFVGFVLSLFPFTILMLSKTDTINDVKNLIKEFTPVDEFDSAITDELIYYIQEFDRDAYNNHLLPCLNQHCLSFIGDARDRQKANNILKSLTKVWLSGNIDAARVNEQQYFVSLWEMIRDIYKHAAKNKSFLLHYQELEDFIRTQIEYLGVKNSIEGLSSAASIFSKIYLEQLQQNCPKQETISDLYWANEDKDAPNPHPDADLQWDYINSIVWAMQQIQQVAIELKSRHLYETIQSEFNSILFGIRYNNNLSLGNYQESFIVNEIISYQTYFASQALENKMFRNSAEAFHFSVHQIADYIKHEKIFSKDIVKLFEEYVLTCQRNNHLDNFRTVKDLGGLGRVIAMEYTNNSTVQSESLAIVEILGKLKNEIENEINFSLSKNYTEIKKQLESLKEGLIKINQISITNKTITKIDEILNSY